MNLLANVHHGLGLPTADPDCKTHIISGTYNYYHYKCDGFNDMGWGCGYRTLQTIASYVLLQSGRMGNVPNLVDIQKTLVEVGDKESNFVGSRDWIGSFEVCLVVDRLYDVPCKILHCPPGFHGLSSVFPKLEEHFAKSLYAPPIMMGGDKDASSKGVLGTCSAGGDNWLLILDPHYQGGHPSVGKLQSEGYVRWVNLKEFDQLSFYNMCLPQFKPLCTI